MKSLKTVYLIAILGTLVPAWIGSFLLSWTEGDQLSEPTAIAALVFFAVSFWGTSFAYLHLRRTRYAVLSGLGKWILIAAGILIFRATGSLGHPYIVFIGIALAMLWCLADLFALYGVTKRVNVERSS